MLNGEKDPLQNKMVNDFGQNITPLQSCKHTFWQKPDKKRSELST